MAASENPPGFAPCPPFHGTLSLAGKNCCYNSRLDQASFQRSCHHHPQPGGLLVKVFTVPVYRLVYGPQSSAYHSPCEFLEIRINKKIQNTRCQNQCHL